MKGLSDKSPLAKCLSFVELVKSVQFQAKKLPEGRRITDDRKIRESTESAGRTNAQNEGQKAKGSAEGS